MAYHFPVSDLLPHPQYGYRPEAIPHRLETRVVLYPGDKPYQTRATREGHYPAFREGSYPAIREVPHHPTFREGCFPTLQEAPYQTVRERFYCPEGPYPTLPEGTYQCPRVEPYQSVYEQIPYQLQVPPQPDPQYLLGSQRISTASPPQLKVQRPSGSSHQSLNDFFLSDNSLTDGNFHSGGEELVGSNTQLPELNFEDFIEVPNLGGTVEDNCNGSTPVETPPDPVRRQCDEHIALKASLEELASSCRKADEKLDKMGKAWSRFADHVIEKGEEDERRMAERIAEVEKKIQEKMDLLLERRGRDEESDY